MPLVPLLLIGEIRHGATISKRRSKCTIGKKSIVKEASHCTKIAVVAGGPSLAFSALLVYLDIQIHG